MIGSPFVLLKVWSIICNVSTIGNLILGICYNHRLKIFLLLLLPCFSDWLLLRFFKNKLWWTGCFNRFSACSVIVVWFVLGDAYLDSNLRMVVVALFGIHSNLVRWLFSIVASSVITVIIIISIIFSIFFFSFFPFLIL